MTEKFFKISAAFIVGCMGVGLIFNTILIVRYTMGVDEKIPNLLGVWIIASLTPLGVCMVVGVILYIISEIRNRS